ncbi:MAG: SDR family oxidoreductase [Acidimicrobiales bacterium]
MQNFTDRNVLVTGGSSGIGLAAARRFAEGGARVAITGRNADALEKAAAEIGHDTLTIRSDAASLDDVTALVETLRSSFGRLDAIFLNAGIARFAPLEATTPELWDEVFAINVRGPYFLIQQAIPLMSEGGSIVLNGSINARIGMPGTSVYGASKAALISLIRTLSAELVASGIRVNAVSPGPVDTPIFGTLGLSDTDLDALSTQIASQLPVGRFGDVDEIAATVTHLASPESGFIVGTEIVVDGGLSQL